MDIKIPEDEFKTILAEVESEISVKGSKFISFLYPVETEFLALERLQALKAKFHDATHHCYAYKVEAGIERFNDDGEPSGSAGKPILASLKGRNLCNVLCAVVRYFGGTKLGVGGLSRAYSEASAAAIEKSKIITKILTDEISLEFPYEMTGAVEHYIAANSAKITQREFGNDAIVTCAVRKSGVKNFIGQFRDITKNRGKVVQK
jgi:uncharacterized YigZ family protein